ncbi:hypothetical protein A167_00076 [Alcanivorax sp. S71-1-4]|jgi:tight adherence protein B|uniref:type II secretion system F family protein n=1 Tax=Alcanivorax sp. S71-1-4 TaxID=1177159 RepID=UPI0013599CD8|nr:type II secretion system F family protein [Alcanivorax sp. S71-1-4]KAF0811044.1 hypothetical protein A167_00076 [Alcanivorax sp. S71-1-4]
MNSEALLSAARMLGLLAILVVVAQCWLLHYRRGRQMREVISARMVSQREFLDENSESLLITGRLEKLLMKAGIRTTQSGLMLLALVLLVSSAVILALYGLVAAVMSLVCWVLLCWVYWNLRYQRLRRTIFDNLPTIIDNVLRNMDAGRSLDQAMIDSLRDAPDVFAPLAFRVRSAVEAGREYAGLFDGYARLYQVPPMVLVAVTLRTTSRFGSSVRPVLGQVSDSLRAQQEMRREFMASTAETRMTAGVFAATPILLSLYMVLMNDTYRDILLGTDTGKIMLMVAGALQAFGVVVIFRMIQGVGRG